MPNPTPPEQASPATGHPDATGYPAPPTSLANAAGVVSSQPKKGRNTLGIVAFVTAVVGFMFACIPGALIVGWVLLPIAFILAIVSLFVKGKGKGLGVAALIISVVGTIVGVTVFMTVVATSFDEAFSGGETTIQPPAAEEAGDESTDADDSVAAGTAETSATREGTRENPLPIGSVITQGDWSVSIDSVNLDAADIVAAENLFNDPAPEGSFYVLANVTATYNGDDADGAMPMVTVAFVTPEGNTINTYDNLVMSPAPFDLLTTLYTGASATGDIVFTVSAADAAEGTLAVTPTMLGDKVFVAVQ